MFDGVARASGRRPTHEWARNDPFGGAGYLMRTMKDVRATRAQLEGVMCDRCGKNCVVYRSEAAGVLNFEGTKIRWDTFGYGSRYDTSDWPSYDLCDDCCDALRSWLAAGATGETPE